MQTILVVDDDFAMRRGIALTLRGDGYTVFEAEDSTTALQLLHENSIELAVVDLFLLGRDGLELAESLLKLSPPTKILMVTAHGEHERAKEAQDQFGENFLDKSQLDKLLLKKVQRLFESVR
ncbi:MAG: response regulator [bacterium]